MAFFAFWVFSFFLMVSGALVVFSKNPVHSVLYLILAFFNGAALFLLLCAELLSMLLVIVYVGAVAVLFLFVVMMLDVHARPLRQSFGQKKARESFRIFLHLLYYFSLFMAFSGACAYGLYHVPAFSPYIGQPQVLAVGSIAVFLMARYGAHYVTGVHFFETLRRALKLVSLPFVLAVIIIGEVLLLGSSYQLTPFMDGAKHLASTGQVVFPTPNNTQALGMMLYTVYLAPFILASLILLVAMVGAIVLTLRPRTEGKKQNIHEQVLRTKESTLTLCHVPLRGGLDPKGGSL
jgi:NADH:ubiquinone oxidoreductase subunit 6 (subunit J)